MMKIVLLLALTVAVYSFSIDDKSRSSSSRKSLKKRSLRDVFQKRSPYDVFHKYDMNSDELLEPSELSYLIYDHGFPWIEAEQLAEYQVKYNDLDGDDALNRWEFTRNPDVGKPFYK